jgi:transposase
MAMVAGRVLSPASKLSTVRQWEDSTLPQLLDVEGATEDELYHAMDWLLEAQPRIEKKLAQRHLENCGLVLYDLTSTYVEGEHCPLAARGHSRDRKPSKLQINFGMLTDEEGRPVSVTVFPGNTADASTVTAQIAKVQDEFGIEHAALVGDRGMIAQTTIEKLKRAGEVEWITALKSQAIRQLQEEGALQLGLFDERNLFELTSSRFPGERFVACRNEQLMKSRRHKRTELIEATRRDLVAIQRSVTAGRLRGESAIGLRVGRVINRHSCVVALAGTPG